MKTHGIIRLASIRSVIMEKVQKVLANDDFFLFLASKNTYINSLTYYENLLL
jgi:hypothetical protein